MKKILFLFLMIPFLVSCSKSDNSVSDEEIAVQTQNNMYDLVKNNIVGHWVGYQYYDESAFGNVGWTDASFACTQEYTFNEDGTVIDQFSKDLIYRGTYTITKNPDYLKYPKTDCEMFVNIYEDGVISKKVIYMENVGGTLCMRIYLSPLSLNASISLGRGEASFRYKKM